MRELILRLADFGDTYAPDSPASRVCAVILDELQALEPSPLHLPLSSDRRLQRVMQGMIEQPAADTGLAYWADQVGASERTLRRLFLRETGMTFQQWRRQLLLHEAVDRLGRGRFGDAGGAGAGLPQSQRLCGDVQKRHWASHRGSISGRLSNQRACRPRSDAQHGDSLNARPCARSTDMSKKNPCRKPEFPDRDLLAYNYAAVVTAAWWYAGKAV